MINIEQSDYFDGHKAIFLLLDPHTGLKAYVAIHRGGIELPAFGATRIWSYDSFKTFAHNVV
jgi:hypothetical protein